MNKNRKNILDEMEIAREYCTFIKRARKELGITSEKYPLFSVWVNHWFDPNIRQVIEHECNFIGYDDIEAVGYLDEYDSLQKGKEFTDGKMKLKIDTQIGHTIQEKIYNERIENRKESVAKKEAGLKESWIRV